MTTFSIFVRIPILKYLKIFTIFKIRDKCYAMIKGSKCKNKVISKTTIERQVLNNPLGCTISYNCTL